MKISVVLGTRPEIVKMSPVIRALHNRKCDYFIIHTGQHYSYNMDRSFFEQLMLPEPRYNLEVGSGTHATQTAKILVDIEEIYSSERPDIILVEGDTNTVLAGALAATKLGIKVGHVEAGLRSYDRRMPEEVNRILTDHCSDFLFAPTEKARTTLLAEGIADSKIYLTGNTIVDAVRQNLDIALQLDEKIEIRGGDLRDYFLVTLHRQENVDDYSRFASILAGLDELVIKYSLPMIYPIHPRSRKMMNKFDLKPKHVKITEPVDFLNFLKLEKNARLILTDSGGVQEESCILGVPCVTIRDSTERPETLDVKANILAGTSPARIVDCAGEMLGRANSWVNPFGDGFAGERIISAIL